MESWSWDAGGRRNPRRSYTFDCWRRFEERTSYALQAWMPTNNGNNNSRGYLACEEGGERLPFSLCRFLFPFCPRYTPSEGYWVPPRRGVQTDRSRRHGASLFTQQWCCPFSAPRSHSRKNEEERRDAPPAMGCCTSSTNEFPGPHFYWGKWKSHFFWPLRSFLIVECRQES